MKKRTAAIILCLVLLAAGPVNGYAAIPANVAAENSASVLDVLQEEA